MSKHAFEKQIKNAPETSGIEYAVYIHLPANQNNRFWERLSTTHDAKLALEQAEMLHYSQKYPRIEVKRKFFCPRRQKRVSETLKTFEQQARTGALGLLGTLLTRLDWALRP